MIIISFLANQLVQTGKALRASLKDGKKRGTLLPANVGKISECNETFNVALDDLESEIVRCDNSSPSTHVSAPGPRLTVMCRSAQKPSSGVT